MKKCLHWAKRQAKLSPVVVQMFSMKVLQRNRQVAAALLLGLILSLQALAVFPALHTLVHPDAAKADHECAVTLFSHGQVDASSNAAPEFRAPACLIYGQSPPEIVFVSADIRLLPSRGPPASPALT